MRLGNKKYWRSRANEWRDLYMSSERLRKIEQENAKYWKNAYREAARENNLINAE